MLDIRKEERKLYAQSRLLKSLAWNEKLNKKQSYRITEKTEEVSKKRLFYHNFILANENIRKGEN